MYTLYSELPGENHDHLFPKARWGRLREVLDQLKAQRNVLNADWYFETIPSYVEGRRIEGCKAGKETLHISPGGMVRPCAELAPVAHYTQFDHVAAEPVACTACFQACRGEVQAPLTPKRVLGLLMQ